MKRADNVIIPLALFLTTGGLLSGPDDCFSQPPPPTEAVRQKVESAEPRKILPRDDGASTAREASPEAADSGPIKGVELSPFNPAEVTQARQDFAGGVRSILLVHDVRQALAKRSIAAFDGTAKMAIGIHLLEIQQTGDEARMIKALTGQTERLRWNIALDHAAKKHLADVQKEKVKQVDCDIREIAERIRQLRQDDPLAELNSVEREMLEQIRFRNDCRRRETEYRGICESYKKEVTHLDRFDRRMDSMRRTARLRLKRLSAAVEHESTTLVSQAVKQDRIDLSETLGMIEGRLNPDKGPVLVSTSDNPVHLEAASDAVIEDASTGKPLTDSERKLIDDELKSLGST